MIVHPSSSNSLEPSLWIRAVPRCVRRGDCFLLAPAVLVVCQTLGGAFVVQLCGYRSVQD